MKKIIIGIYISFLGSLNILIQIICATQLIPKTDRWSGSILWYLIFDKDRLDLGIYFTFSIVLILIGIIILLTELKDKTPTS